MKKLLIFISILTIVLVGCSGENEEESPQDTSNNTSENTAETDENDAETEESEGDSEMSKLTLQVLKTDEANGLTLENNDLYKELTRVINENPNIGTPNDFSMQTVNSVNEGQENAAYIFLAINRTDVAMKNIMFNFTMGIKDGEKIWENEKIGLSEDTAGVLQPNSAVPVIIPLTPEQESLIDNLTSENTVLELSNFQYESAE